MDTDITVGQDQPETFIITSHGLIQRKYAMPFTDERTLARLIEETRA
jgi:hypothetical protein